MSANKTTVSPGSFLLEYSAASTRRNLSLPPRSPAAASSSVHVVIVAPHADASLTPLLYGCAILDLNVRVIGWKDHFKKPRRGWQARRILDLCEELEEDEVVVVIDGCYGLALQPKEVVLDKFREFRGSIVCMASKSYRTADGDSTSFFPSIGIRKAPGSRPVPTEPHAGAFIGYAGTIARALAAAHVEDIAIQVLFSSIYRDEQNDTLSIDLDCSIFHQCYSSNSIRILSYAEAHAQAVHQSPQGLASSPFPHPELHPSTSRQASLPAQPPPSRPYMSLSSSSSLRFASVPSIYPPEFPQLSSPSSEYTAVAGASEPREARPAPFFRPSPLQKVAMDVTTGETPCFLLFTDRVCASAVLEKVALFPDSLLPQGQWHQQQQLLRQEVQHQELSPKRVSEPTSFFGAETWRCRRIHAKLRRMSASSRMLRTYLHIVILFFAIVGVHLILGASGLSLRLLGGFPLWFDSVFRAASAFVSRVLFRWVAGMMQAIPFIANYTILWSSMFLSCCFVGLFGAACCGSPNGAKEHIFDEWWQRDQCTEQRMGGENSSLTSEMQDGQRKTKEQQAKAGLTQEDSVDGSKEQSQEILLKTEHIQDRTLSNTRKPHLAVWQRTRSRSIRRQHVDQHELKQHKDIELMLQRMQTPPQLQKVQQTRGEHSSVQRERQSQWPKGRRQSVKRTSRRSAERSKVPASPRGAAQKEKDYRTSRCAPACASLTPISSSASVGKCRTRAAAKKARDATPVLE